MGVDGRSYGRLTRAHAHARADTHALRVTRTHASDACHLPLWQAAASHFGSPLLDLFARSARARQIFAPAGATAAGTAVALAGLVVGELDTLTGDEDLELVTQISDL